MSPSQPVSRQFITITLSTYIQHISNTNTPYIFNFIFVTNKKDRNEQLLFSVSINPTPDFGPQSPWENLRETLKQGCMNVSRRFSEQFTNQNSFRKSVNSIKFFRKRFLNPRVKKFLGVSKIPC